MDHLTRITIPAALIGERIGIVGSRNYPHLSDVQSYIAALPPDAVVVSGGAEGVDKTAEMAARFRGLAVVSYRLAVVSYRPRHPKKHIWKILRVTLGNSESRELEWLDEEFPSFGQAAYFRNRLIVNDSRRIAAFWNGHSRGTRHTLQLAREAGRPAEVFLPQAVDA